MFVFNHILSILWGAQFYCYFLHFTEANEGTPNPKDDSLRLEGTDSVRFVSVP